MDFLLSVLSYFVVFMIGFKYAEWRVRNMVKDSQRRKEEADAVRLWYTHGGK